MPFQPLQASLCLNQCRIERTWILKKVTEVHIFTAHTLPPYTWKPKLGADVSTQELQRRVR